MNQRAFSEYRQTSLMGTSTLGQVVALYQAILRDFHRALAAHERGQIENRVNAMNHALAVLAELQGVLDFEKGGAVAQQLDRFYKVGQAEILKVCTAPSRDGFQRLIAMYKPVCEAWQTVSKQLPAMPARETVPEKKITMTAPTSKAPGIETEERETRGLWRG
jgi:flagellar secretion chaperone FliS